MSFVKHYYDTDSFINKMMEETYRSLPGEDSGRPSAQLLDYFNEKSIVKEKIKSLEDIFHGSSTDFFKVSYVEKTGCFRVEQMNIDFPSNWSIFKTLKNALKNELNLLLGITEFEHRELFLIMKKFCSHDAKLYFTASKEGAYIAFARVENISFEDTVNKYFVLKSNETSAVA